MYYRVYLKTKNGQPLPQQYGFNYLAFSGQADMPNFPFSSQLNVEETMNISDLAYGGPNSNPWLQFLEVDKKGEVTWVVGDATLTCSEPPVNLNLNTLGGTTNKVLLFILVFDALPGDQIDFDAEDSHIVDCACLLNQGDDVESCPTVIMPPPPPCPTATVSFLDIYWDMDADRYLIPVKVSGLTGQSVQRMDGAIHILPEMNSISQLDFEFLTSGQGPSPMEFRKRKNDSDGSFDVFFSFGPSAWIPSSSEPIIFFIGVDGLFNLSQGGSFNLHLTTGRKAMMSSICSMSGVDKKVIIPGKPCSSPLTLESDASIGTNCAMSIDYSLSSSPPATLTFDKMFLRFIYDKLTVPPGMPTGNLPCPDCWTLSTLNNWYILTYDYDINDQGGIPLELSATTIFHVDFPGQTKCLEPFVYYAHALEHGKPDECALSVFINDFPICDPRISVQFYSPTGGGLGVYDYKSKLENASGSYMIVNKDDCKKQVYCPDLDEAPFTLTASIANNNPLCGVSTFDMVRIAKHVLMVKLFTMPAEYVAADIDNNAAISTFDIVELRKLILGNYNDFPANQSWHYVDDAWTFPQPNPLAGGIYQDKNVIHNVQPGSKPVFKAIKVGDLTGDCNCGISPAFEGGVAENRHGDEENVSDWLVISVGKVKDESTGLVSIPVFADGRAAWLGLQSGFRFDSALFEFVSVSPNVDAGISMGNFGLGKTAIGEIRFSWSFSDPDALLAANEWLFTVQLKKKEGLNAPAMNKWLSLDNAIMKSEAYADMAGEASITELKLKWDDSPNSISNVTGLSVHAAPNPFKQAASTIFINAITPGPATIELADLNGKTASSQQTDLQIGENRVQLSNTAEKLPPGTWLLIVRQNGQSAFRRIIKM